MSKRPVFKKTPICEVCGKEPAEWFTQYEKRGWMFTCICTEGAYDIAFHRFFHSPSSTVDWLAHLHEKDWMQWNSFMAMMRRFREATDSFLSI